MVTSSLTSSFHILTRRNPALFALMAYAAYALAGAVLLSLPFTQETALETPVHFVDALFMSTSAVSTTGLATLDTGTTFNFVGELVILILIQIGGLGYMTIMSITYLIIRDNLSANQMRLTRAGLGLPENLRIAQFVRRIALATALIEMAGAIVLAVLFYNEGQAQPVWKGIFHSISSFCTAGFALYPTSFEGFRHNAYLLMAISILSYAGALGFIVMAESYDRLFGRKRKLNATTKVILRVSFGLLLASTVLIWVFEPSIRALPIDQQMPNALFQAMTASTTVGFNSLPIGAMSSACILVLYALMFIGASPAGTGGGLKTTTAGILWATAWCAITGREQVRVGQRKVPKHRVFQAAASLIIALLVISVAIFLLDVTGNYAFDKALFEVISALATVGLSMGLTGELNDAGKLIITAVMLIGRVGILGFFIAFARWGTENEPEVIRSEDIVV